MIYVFLWRLIGYSIFENMKKNTAYIPFYKGQGYLARHREFFSNPLRFSLEKSRELGDFFRSNMLMRSLFFVANPDVIQHVLQTNQKNYLKSPAYRQLRLALGQGLITSEGDFWRKQRRLAQPAFHKKQLEGLFELMVEVSEEYIDDLSKRCRESRQFNISKEMMKVTADIVLKTLFHADTYGDQQTLYRTMVASQEYIMYCVHNPHLIPWTYLNGRRRRFFRELKVFDDIVKGFIEERRQSKDPPPDLLTMLVQARDADTGEGMSDRQLRDEAITIFAAGHETSANALSWTLYLLAQHPQVLDRLRSEVEVVLGDRLPEFTDLSRLQYTRQVIEEGMRKYPPAWAIGREAIEADVILGEPIPKKAVIFMSIYALHHHLDLWDQPEVFNPDRFDPELARERSRWHYLPFGAGPRMCIGNNFAMMEMQILLAMLVRRFDFHMVEEHPVEMRPLITLKPRHGILMELNL